MLNGQNIIGEWVRRGTVIGGCCLIDLISSRRLRGVDAGTKLHQPRLMIRMIHVPAGVAPNTLPSDNIVIISPFSIFVFFFSSLYHVVVLSSTIHIVRSLTEHSLVSFIRSIVDHHDLYSPGWLQYATLASTSKSSVKHLLKTHHHSSLTISTPSKNPKNIYREIN